MNTRNIILTALACCSISVCSHAQGFLKRDGKKIVDGNGTEIILRGIGPGGWMLQEPYMLNIKNTANQTEIRSKIETLIGTANTEEFYAAWLKNYMTRADVDSVASFGFNSIRLPMHYNLFTLPIDKEPVAGENTWLDKGFVMVDSLLAWCKANKVYLILDMHATPGGQGKDAAISDYNSTQPSLWESAENKAKLIALWKKLAERYVNEEYIGGYDLINEPNWDFENSGNQNGCNCNSNTPLFTMYKDLITAVRTIDKNHLVIVEGNCWGNRYNGMYTLASFDNNIAFSFHKYWNDNNTGAISGLLDLRNTYNVPLWCGESGENSNTWYTSAIKLLEDNKIGWAWWTWKKFASISGSNSVTETADYKTITNYWAGTGTKPSAEVAKKGLMEMAENLKLEKCTNNRSVIDAMFRQVKTAETKPFTKLSIPGKIHAADYDLGRNNSAYFDIDTADYHVTSGTYTSWNSGWGYRNDGVDIEACLDSENKIGYSVGWTNVGEWIAYTVTVDSSAVYDLTMRYAGQNASTTMHFELDGSDITGAMELPSTGKWDAWSSLVFNNIALKKGVHTLKVFTDKGGVNISFYEFSISGTLASLPFKIVSSTSSVDGSKVVLMLNKDVDAPLSTNTSDFEVKVNGISDVITAVNVPDGSPNQIELTLTDKIGYSDVIIINYTGSSVKDIFGLELAQSTDLQATNRLPVSFIVPCKIEAEDYMTQVGLSFETCTEGGKNAGYTNAGDYLDYRLKVKEAGSYAVNIRSAAQAAGGSLELQLFDANNTKTSVGTFSIPATGDWQAWKTVEGTVDLPKGDFILRVYIKSPEFNLNWISFAVANSLNSKKFNSKFEAYPNPVKDFLYVDLKISSQEDVHYEITDIQGRKLQASAPKAIGNKLDVSNLQAGVYCLKITSGKETGVTTFVKN